MMRRNRSRPRDTDALHRALKRGTAEEFEAVYKPDYVNYDGYAGASLLTLALANPHPDARVHIATRLLDDGADVTVWHPLHVLFGQDNHDFQAEAALAQRMLDQGADVNLVYPGAGTPLEIAADQFKFTDEELSPFYDVLLAHPEIDLLQPGLDGRPVLTNLRKAAALRGNLVKRAEALLMRKGLPLPGPTG